LIGGKTFSSQLAANILKGIPELKEKFLGNSVEVEREAIFRDVEEWNEKLGLRLRSAEGTFGDSARGFWSWRRFLVPEQRRNEFEAGFEKSLISGR
jgi:hypothetical protein